LNSIKIQAVKKAEKTTYNNEDEHFYSIAIDEDVRKDLGVGIGQRVVIRRTAASLFKRILIEAAFFSVTTLLVGMVSVSNIVSKNGVEGDWKWVAVTVSFLASLVIIYCRIRFSVGK
jgi:hypothetical protein